MKLLPPGRADLLDYMRTHLGTWEGAYESIGLGAEEVAVLAELLSEAEAARAEALKARDAAEAATLNSNDRINALRRRAALAIARIKVFARTQASAAGEPAGHQVYSDARIAPGLEPAPLPAPEKIERGTITVSPSGRPTLTWKPPHPRDARERAASSSGLTYAVSRQRPGETRPTIVHVGGKPTFTDTPIPAMPGATTYMIRALRGDRAGPWGMAMRVELGGDVGSGEGVADGPPMRVAA